MARLVVDRDVASFVFKWRPEFAPRFAIIRGFEFAARRATDFINCRLFEGNWSPSQAQPIPSFIPLLS
jgi:hypothetical protein